MMAKPRLVVGMSGASGPQLGVRLLEALREAATHEIHLVVTPGAALTIKHEMPGRTLASIKALADVIHDDRDLAAPIASGSFLHEGMIVIPASMKTCGNLAACNAGNLLVRAADVTIKERRTLILVPRETPLHLGHLRILTSLAEMGALIIPPAIAFYHHPKTLEDAIDQLVGKCLDSLHVPHALFRRWGS